MEGLVNYSSEDEQDEKNYKSAAERGTHFRRTPPTHAAEHMRRRGGNGVGSSAVPCANTSGGGRGYKEEARYTSSTTSAYSSNRSNSQARNSREHRGEPRDNRDHRETRENRDFKDNSSKEYRDTRDYSNGNKNDYKHERFNRSKEYDNRDHRRDDNFRDHRRPRDDDRNQHGGSGGNYNNRNSSHHKDNRYSNNSRYNDSFTPRRYQRSHDDRIDSRPDRHATTRKQRSPASHSPSPPASSSSSHSKRYSNRDDEQRTRNRARSRSRSRSRTKSRSPRTHKRSPSPRSAYKPLDQARSTALDLERKLNASEPKVDREPLRPETQRHTEAVLTLPLSDSAPKPPTVIAVAPISNSGSSEPAVIQLPSYYNPSVINPNKYAEQVQKRKLIWGAKKAEDTSAKWGHAQFSQDSDGKVASKFMRLMGIKGGVATPKSDATSTETDRQPVTVTDVKSREKMFNSMEQQYEVARQVTHTMRGVGLGFGSQTRPF